MQRLNVVITRAKCLLIIIGDPHTLARDNNWRRVIDYCIENKSLIQGDKVYPVEVVNGRAKKNKNKK